MQLSLIAFVSIMVNNKERTVILGKIAVLLLFCWFEFLNAGDELKISFKEGAR